MCRTGGPRCYNEAYPAALAAQGAYMEADAEVEHLRRSGDEVTWAPAPGMTEALDKRHEARENYLIAIADMYASPQGKDKIDEHFAEGVDFPFTLGEVKKQSDYQQRRGKIVRAVRAAGDGDLGDVFGAGVDEEADAIVDRAARVYVADYQSHSQRPHRIPGVARYETEEAKERGVRKWARGVKDQARNYAAHERYVEHAEHDVRLVTASAEAYPDDELAQRRLREAQGTLEINQRQLVQSRTRLVVLADKLRIAQQREVAAASGTAPASEAVTPIQPLN